METLKIFSTKKKGAIILEKNGKSLSNKRTKHINTRYFFVTDKIIKCEMAVKWCPMGEITGYLLTKPNQGLNFIIFRDLIMGVMNQIYPRNGKQET